MPDAMEIIYHAALEAGRNGAVWKPFPDNSLFTLFCMNLSLKMSSLSFMYCVVFRLLNF